MSKPKKREAPTPITSLTHSESRRTNIPTEELGDFMADDEKAPKTVLYPHDPSLDLQLVSRGKDEQDASSLELPVYAKWDSLEIFSSKEELI
jgi:adenine-specific DNA-methyltransferase